jgi:xanthine dehydrogenase accessory factor
MTVWPTIARMLADHGAAALVTLAEAEGSSPREPGARMIVAPDHTFTGTIGGGALEWEVLAEAHRLLDDPQALRMRRIERILGPDLGQCCGGRVGLTIEIFGSWDHDAVTLLAHAEREGEFVTIALPGEGRPVRTVVPAAPLELGADEDYRRLADGRVVERFGDARTELYLFGAGHVGRALIAAVTPLPFRVTWVDPRADAFPSENPPNVHCIVDKEPVYRLLEAPDGAFVVVMTHSHGLDLDLVITALQGPGVFPYVGLIGSETKRARFVSAMRKLEIPDVDRLVCPIGLPGIRDKAPAAIAAAVAAQLLIVREDIRGKVDALVPERARHG